MTPLTSTAWTLTTESTASHNVRRGSLTPGAACVRSSSLPDEYLPAGALTVSLSARQTSEPPPGAVPVMRIVVSELDGTVACAREVQSHELPADRLSDVVVPCRLSRDTAATVAVFSLGAADLAVDAVGLRWTDPQRF